MGGTRSRSSSSAAGSGMDACMHPKSPAGQRYDNVQVCVRERQAARPRASGRRGAYRGDAAGYHRAAQIINAHRRGCGAFIPAGRFDERLSKTTAGMSAAIAAAALFLAAPMAQAGPSATAGRHTIDHCMGANAAKGQSAVRIPTAPFWGKRDTRPSPIPARARTMQTRAAYTETRNAMQGRASPDHRAMR